MTLAPSLLHSIAHCLPIPEEAPVDWTERRLIIPLPDSGGYAAAMAVLMLILVTIVSQLFVRRLARQEV